MSGEQEGVEKIVFTEDSHLKPKVSQLELELHDFFFVWGHVHRTNSSQSESPTKYLETPDVKYRKSI